MAITPTQKHKCPILVFGVTSRLGSGCSSIRDAIKNSIASYGYDVTIIRVTELIKELSEHGKFDFETAEDRIRAFQRKGSLLAKAHGNDYLGQLSARAIAKSLDDQDALRNSTRTAYIIDSIKRPEEALFLRRIFGGAFFLVGVVASDHKRFERVAHHKSLSKETFDELSDIDAGRANSSNKHSQRTVDTVVLSDYILKNDFSTKSS